MMEPTPKNPSTVFMIEVCSAVEREMSPMSASAPVLKIPMATPDSAIRAQKNRKELPARNRYDEAAKSVRPATMVVLRPYRSARCPSKNPAMAMPPIVAY